METTVQQGYRQNLKRIGLLVIKLNTADYQKDSKSDVVMVISGHFESRDQFMWLTRKILFEAFSKCTVHGVLNIRNTGKFVLMLKK